jgi:hypothetical protein
MPFFRNFPKTEFDFEGRGIDTTVTDIFRYVKPIDDYIDDISVYKFHQVGEGQRPDQVSQELYGTPIYYWTFFILNEHLRAGLSEWPLGQQEFEDYMAEEYNGTVINTRPEIVLNSDGDITEFRNSVADRFNIGETITGILSGAKGRLVSKDAQLQQITIEDVTGHFQSNELIRGDNTFDEITSYQVFQRQHAPKCYVDGEGREVDNSLFIYGATYMNPDLEELYTKTHREYEEERNERNREIRVVKPGIIKKFAERYRKLIQGV